MIMSEKGSKRIVLNLTLRGFSSQQNFFFFNKSALLS